MRARPAVIEKLIMKLLQIEKLIWYSPNEMKIKKVRRSHVPKKTAFQNGGKQHYPYIVGSICSY